ncbi:MAG: hypothetical protein DRO46_01620 [Candidatus Hecatellales archaeon]|nr:MAG: hypothetical protein DRO46_01620 [Candidatus Hecatellales archaeon]
MGEVFRPEGFPSRKLPQPPGDLPLKPLQPQPFSLQALYQQLQELREEIEKIKRTLEKHGIKVD